MNSFTCTLWVYSARLEPPESFEDPGVVPREQYSKKKRYSAHHTDASTLHSDEGRGQLRYASVSR